MSRSVTAALVALLAGAAAPVPDAPSIAATTGIPAPAVRAYVSASHRTGAPWQLLAAVADIESRHCTIDGRRLLDDGHPDRPIYGPDLGGPSFTFEFAQIDDTDQGVLDDRPLWDRAVGCFQFIPGTWPEWACDGDNDGVEDPQDVDDAACAAGRKLASHGDLAQPGVLREALLAYNRSDAYVAEVLAQMNTYASEWPGTPESGRAGGLWVKLERPVRAINWPPLTRAYGRVSAQLGIVSTVDPAPAPAGEIVAVDGIEVDSSMAAGLRSLLAAARADGIHLSGSGYRSNAEQRQLRRQNCTAPDDPGSWCSPLTAMPGSSNHELGLAVDFRMADGSSLTSEAAGWLAANGPRFGFLFAVPGEPWHGSVTGS